MKKYSIILTLAVLIMIAGSSFVLKTYEKESSTITLTVPQDDDPAAAKYPNGAKIYKEKCIVCHQITGEGIPGAFPPLKNSDYLLADKKRAVAQVLNGSTEHLTINGTKYMAPMPPQLDNHQDAVDVVNYVLNSWGNDGGTVKLEDVKDIKIVR
jgi:nitrite reductase (NO-forming)